MKRKIIKIDTEKCMGCGDCIPGCPEGALQLIDGKARLISDLFCDGLGACIGSCPVDAIKIEERDAEPYDEKKTMENIIKGGANVIKAHLLHLNDHGEETFLKEAMEVLKEKNIPVPEFKDKRKDKECGCPGAKMIDFSEGKRGSELRQWPVQLHLVPPNAPYFKGRDVILAADCIAYTLADFHKDYLKDKSLAIACPKLDADKEIYINKIKTMIDEAKINTLTVMIMEVPCCGGLLAIAKEAQAQAKRKIPIKSIIVGLQGNILSEEWV